MDEYPHPTVGRRVASAHLHRRRPPRAAHPAPAGRRAHHRARCHRCRPKCSTVLEAQPSATASWPCSSSPHDLGVVAGRATTQVLVMYAGQVVEEASTATLFSDMKMPYTEALLHSIPKIAEASHTRLTAIPGRPPDLVDPPKGCRFAARCRCLRAGSLSRGAGHAVAARCRPRSRVPVLVPGGHARGRRGPGPQPGRGRLHTDGSHLVAGTGTAHLRPENDVLLRVEKTSWWSSASKAAR